MKQKPPIKIGRSTFTSFEVFQMVIMIFIVFWVMSSIILEATAIYHCGLGAKFTYGKWIGPAYLLGYC